jgi:RNA polymerase sigma factor (TIGR02999 family)
MEPTADLTHLLLDVQAGRPGTLDRLLPLVYDELRALASRRRRFERPDHTLNTTALVHEAYLRLVDQRQATWQNRAHFFAIAATAMRRILLEYARSRRALKRGGEDSPVRLGDLDNLLPDEQTEELLALDEALQRLAAFNERGSRVVEYRYFVGLTNEEIAEVMDLSVMTVRRAWEAARAWLTQELQHDAP